MRRTQGITQAGHHGPEVLRHATVRRRVAPAVPDAATVRGKLMALAVILGVIHGVVVR